MGGGGGGGGGGQVKCIFSCCAHQLLAPTSSFAYIFSSSV